MIAAIAVVGLLVLALRVRTPSWAVGVGLLLGGAVTHLGDRVAREPGFARGHVVDSIDNSGLFVGNVADIALVVRGRPVDASQCAGRGVRPSRPYHCFRRRAASIRETTIKTEPAASPVYIPPLAVTGRCSSLGVVAKKRRGRSLPNRVLHCVPPPSVAPSVLQPCPCSLFGILG
ncbi:MULTISPECIES: signal peptidase II [Rhodococcus]|uniref:signal peptidase II n=1 Tax=Rhodococcus TaxID=1827 RepID=UPI001186B036|nr:signal peptidase II [Rhodococcus pyridinivorans]